MTVSAKATRLVAEDRVRPEGCAAVLSVTGEHDTYRVVLGDGFALCDCPALREDCSHVLASRLMLDGLASERASAHIVSRAAA